MNLTRRRLLRASTIPLVGAIAGCNGESSTQTTTTETTTTDVEPTTSETLSAPQMGDTDAPVVVESFEDFTCGYCRQFNLEILPQMVEEYIETGDVRFRRRDFPFLDEEWSWKAAHAARAVQEKQGDKAFFEYAHLLYQHFDSYSEDRFADLADQVDVAPEFVRQAVKEERYLGTLEAEKARGNEKNVRDARTPAVFIDGNLVQSEEFWVYANAIETALRAE